MDVSLAAAVLSLGASVAALIAAMVAVIAAKRFRGAAEVKLDRIAHQLAALDQAWYWAPEWQAGEAEADADRTAGRSTRYHSDEEFLASLRDVPAADEPARAQ